MYTLLYFIYKNKSKKNVVLDVDLEVDLDDLE